jgi:3-oxoacyl-[acyl-carrier protein] reductase
VEVEEVSRANQVVVITGASRGLGREIALRFARSGARVAVNFEKDWESAEQVVHEIKRHGTEALAFQADVSRHDQVDELVSGVTKRFGRIDVVVNNSGIRRDSLFIRMNQEDWHRVISVNLTGVFNVTQAVLPVMRRQRKGHIINISSIAAVVGRVGQANYCASKAGLIGFTRSLAKEVGRFGIQVNLVFPGYLSTDLSLGVSPEVIQRAKQESVFGRLGDKREVADFVVYLTSLKGVSGQVFGVDSRICGSF